MNDARSLHARRPCWSPRTRALIVLAASLTGACEPIRPNERPIPPVSARASRELGRDAEAVVHVSGFVDSDPVRGAHELALTIVNGSRWTLTEVRVAVEGDAKADRRPKEYVLRSRAGLGPGQAETLSTRLDVDSGFGRPPVWRYVGAVGYPPVP